MALAPWLRAAVPWLTASAVLVALSLLTRYLAYEAQRADPGSAPLDVLRVFDVNSEANVPTVWSVTLLVGAAAVCLRRVDAATARSHYLRRGWWTLAALLLLLALDEALALHERLGGVGAAVSGGALHFAWVVPGAALGAVLAATTLAALRRHDKVLRVRLVLSGIVYVVGAVGLETLSGAVLRAQGDRVLYVAVTALEEGAEMAALSLVLAAVLLQRRADGRRPPIILLDLPQQSPANDLPVAAAGAKAPGAASVRHAPPA